MKQVVKSPITNEAYECEGCCFNYNGFCEGSDRQVIECCDEDIIYTIKNNDDEK